MLKGKTVLLGVTGSIAAYKAAELASLLVKQHAEVHVIMTKNACCFIHPITFETLTGRKCLTDTFDRNFEFQVEHISLAKKADLAIVAPATANVIGKLAGGIADDMLTTTLLACTCPVLIAPAMNTRMYENRIVQENMEKLQKYGMRLLTPDSGRLACGDDGKGKLPKPSRLLDQILLTIAREKDLQGLNLLVTAGPTQESLDPVRYLTNHSTGKMGYAIARAAALRGASVLLVSGPVSLETPAGVQRVDVTTAADMYAAVTEAAPDQNIIIKAAAVADYRPSRISDQKLKKKEDDLVIPLERTQDILGFLGSHKTPGQFLCGFSMETQNMVENSRQKLNKKNLDLIVANNLKQTGAGFGTDTNIVTMIDPQETKELPCMSKMEVADAILDRILALRDTKPEKLCLKDEQCR